ncbi:hypothetical protein LSAT2_028160 [Lamellibrachia satsuma]|nr:hypothetical protein LSAT2_028160 [Lamellibrachia satsuma]
MCSVHRTLRIHLRACSKAQKCSEMSVKPMLIVRDTDTVAKTEAGDLTLKLVTSGDTKNAVTVKTTKQKAATAATADKAHTARTEDSA